MAVEEKVKQIIVEQLQVDEAEVTPGASFQEDLGADSLDVVELNPAFDVHNRTARLAVDLIESLFGKSTLVRRPVWRRPADAHPPADRRRGAQKESGPVS